MYKHKGDKAKRLQDIMPYYITKPEGPKSDP